MKIVVAGNCQTKGIANCLRIMNPGLEVQRLATELTEKQLAGADIMVCQHVLVERARHVVGPGTRMFRIPALYYPAFHPDLVYVRAGNKPIMGPLGQYHSSIALYGWMNDLGRSQTLSLFRDEVFERLGFYDFEAETLREIDAVQPQVDIPFRALVDKWRAAGCFMYSVNHPKLSVIEDIARETMRGLGLDILVDDPSSRLVDNLHRVPVWPVYPEIGARLGCQGAYEYHASEWGAARGARDIHDLDEFVDLSYDAYDGHKPSDIVCSRLASPRYKELRGFIARGGSIKARTSAGVASMAPEQFALAKASPAGTTHPYKGLPDHQFWRRSISGVEAEMVDPVVAAPFTIDKTMRVATAGSCFAQHISGALSRHGFNYYIPESAPKSMPAEQARAANYGVFSARYGNIYTARQLLQLIERAHGRFTPEDSVWRRPDGRFADPFRPEIEPAGFKSPRAVELAREQHLEAVREMLVTLDILVFTLGLTEGWVSRRDGAAFPLAPGVSAGEMDFERYAFVNFSVDQITRDMGEVLSLLRVLNPRARMILTVSPVPLAATYEDRHVLVSTTLSKSVLRVAADQLARAHDNVWYFPSYEIITGSFNRGAYFGPDLREVKQEGVDHVMRLFLKHGARIEPDAPAAAASPLSSALHDEIAAGAQIVCEEELVG